MDNKTNCKKEVIDASGRENVNGVAYQRLVYVMSKMKTENQ